ncbi:hypothetical protein SB89_13655 [Corynebacterium glutamicum]|uniref:Uncharacterized protein n=1 Tax=Corynebacterium glutamicum (strain ATCC 13032 / DSM 20300 / JCM 1318 / BCRC 11384 / CCUG 27702 / LMG 3730 / NBRC 12168 / NCIMB 10025 / NRRL B-2784 / 534) TaxID=196627 RepID=Q8NLP2_CORGL|nr:hypothetical protein SB89_13655 [Corynebacterium glutamicum]CAF20920.1 hypothetical protein cg3205 [Corynebacterium glutamicum ATCC 13032]CCH26017.1 hypothetical protein WA5_2797 [Corynebacterium glutamicum K051]OKX94174.1 hypothetical protein AUP72_04325 [Corynebacterium glutamicum]TWS40759.1 hypothetical protein AKJ21_00450 [Corynebacterium glutamicum]
MVGLWSETTFFRLGKLLFQTKDAHFLGVLGLCT